MAVAIRLPGLGSEERRRRADGSTPPHHREPLNSTPRPHVAARPDGSIDWQSTLAFRDYLVENAFGLADAMDTAQRGMGLRWPQTQQLIARSGAWRGRLSCGALTACGAGTDQLPDVMHPLADHLCGPTANSWRWSRTRVPGRS